MDDETREALADLRRAVDALTHELQIRELRAERDDVDRARELLAIERRLSSIDQSTAATADALADWAAHYWHHTDHPPRHDAA